MKSVSPELDLLAKFAISTEWKDLPATVVHETKRLLLDSIGCAFTGMSVDPGKMIVAVARRLGGPPESTIIGVGDKVSVSTAVLANGQLINATDFDAFAGGGHGPGFLIPGPLAMAESLGASGRDLILATAVAVEIAQRVKSAVRPIIDKERKTPDWDFMIKGREGYASCNFGVAAGLGKLLNLDQEKMMHALSISGHACEVLTWTHVSLQHRGHPLKYGIPGWQGTGAVMAVFLAEMGYEGDLDVFNSEHGFWKFAGYGAWQPENITDGLGKKWSFDEGSATYKPHICCRIYHAAMDAFYDIIEKNNLTADEIKSVKVIRPIGPDWTGLFRNTEIGNIVDAQFSVPYNISCAAHRIKAGVEWQDIDTMRDPKILKFMEKVSVTGPDSSTSMVGMQRVEVEAKGNTFAEERTAARGGSISSAGNIQLTDLELEKKFRHNAVRILSEGQINRAANALWNLEKLENIKDLIDQITL
jgi:2-methylcitrate dehydratase PrpD